MFFVLSGCVPSSYERFENASSQAKGMSLEQGIFRTKIFNINYFVSKKIDNSKELNIFIEGDGFAWVDKYTPSDNPTPINPVALKIALYNFNSNLIYLSRPCQNVFENDFRNCEQKYWTKDRFEDEIIDSIDETIESFKLKHQNSKINLFGYSGGGVVALLVAKRRDDVAKVVTFASNIDTEFWSSYHGISPLNGDNPANFCKELNKINQVHYVGKVDNIVPIDIALSYAKKCDNHKNIKIKVIDGFDHSLDWQNINKTINKEQK